jgi:hypothetical protein
VIAGWSVSELLGCFGTRKSRPFDLDPAQVAMSELGSKADIKLRMTDVRCSRNSGPASSRPRRPLPV